VPLSENRQLPVFNCADYTVKSIPPGPPCKRRAVPAVFF